MTEHAAVIFVFFFLAEYASIVLICILTSILFLGGYLYNNIPLLSMIWMMQYLNINDFYNMNIFDISYLIDFLQSQIYNRIENSNLFIILCNPTWEGMLYGISLGIKTCLMIFVFIWVRASFPRIRFDQLMSFCWLILLPVVIGFIILIPCILYSFTIIPSNILLF